jgi:hypothetical protein
VTTVNADTVALLWDLIVLGAFVGCIAALTVGRG